MYDDALTNRGISMASGHTLWRSKKGRPIGTHRKSNANLANCVRSDLTPKL